MNHIRGDRTTRIC